MKDAYYFRHDANAHNDPKMLSLRLKVGWEGIGLYWTFLEILRDLPNYKYRCSATYQAELELRLSLPQATLQAWLKACIEVNLLIENDGFLYSASFLKRMKEIDEKRAILSAAGRRGGIKSRQAKARFKPPSSSKVKESKVKESKVDQIKSIFSDCVLLTKIEFEKLEMKFGANITHEKIQELNDAIMSKDYKYKSHYHTILNWHRIKNKPAESLKPNFPKPKAYEHFEPQPPEDQEKVRTLISETSKKMS